MINPLLVALLLQTAPLSPVELVEPAPRRLGLAVGLGVPAAAMSPVLELEFRRGRFAGFVNGAISVDPRLLPDGVRLVGGARVFALDWLFFEARAFGGNAVPAAYAGPGLQANLHVGGAGLVGGRVTFFDRLHLSAGLGVGVAHASGHRPYVTHVQASAPREQCALVCASWFDVSPRSAKSGPTPGSTLVADSVVRVAPEGELTMSFSF